MSGIVANPAPEAFQVRDLVGHLLRVSQARATALWSRELQNGLTSTQFAVLHVLAMQDGIDQTRLRLRASLDRSTAGDLIQRLVERGWITRVRDTSDTRRNNLFLTDAGREFYRDSVSPALRSNDILLCHVDETERRDLYRLLRKLVEPDEEITEPTHNRGFRTRDLVGHLLRVSQARATALWSRELQNGLTSTQFAVLHVLAMQDGIDQTRLRLRASLDRSTAGDLIQRLVERGWITRVRDTSDTRRNNLFLTDAGREFYRDSVSPALRSNDILLCHVDETERRDLYRLLRKLVEPDEEITDWTSATKAAPS